MSFIKFQIWRIKKFFVNDYFSNIKNQLIEYENLYKDELTTEKEKLLSLFTDKKYNLYKQLKKIFYPKMFRQNIIDEIFLRIMFLIGKL